MFSNVATLRGASNAIGTHYCSSKGFPNPSKRPHRRGTRAYWAACTSGGSGHGARGTRSGGRTGGGQAVEGRGEWDPWQRWRRYRRQRYQGRPLDGGQRGTSGGFGVAAGALDRLLHVGVGHAGAGTGRFRVSTGADPRPPVAKIPHR